jgi:hypothetical protein
VRIGERIARVAAIGIVPTTAETVEPLLTAAEVGHMLTIPTKRVYEVVGHLANQLAPHTLRWRSSDIVALIEERRRSK